MRYDSVLRQRRAEPIPIKSDTPWFHIGWMQSRPGLRRSRAQNRRRPGVTSAIIPPSVSDVSDTVHLVIRLEAVCVIRSSQPLSVLAVTPAAFAQVQDDDSSSATMRPVIRGRQYAVSSMKQEATEAAARILESGGNAFDAIVAGQAVLALVNPESNGLGGDAVILVYHARRKKVYSINAEGTAPKLATIDWYNKNNGGKIPNSDGLLSASLPGVIDAWYVLLDRWGTMTFAQVLEQAIDVAENGFPIGDGLARAIAGSKKDPEISNHREGVFSGWQGPAPGDIFRNVDSARMLRKLVEAEQARRDKVGARRCRPRAIASIKATSPRPWRSSPNRTAAFIGTRISRRIPPRWKRRCR